MGGILEPASDCETDWGQRAGFSSGTGRNGLIYQMDFYLVLNTANHMAGQDSRGPINKLLGD